MNKRALGLLCVCMCLCFLICNANTDLKNDINIEEPLHKEFDSIFNSIVKVQYSSVSATDRGVRRMYEISELLGLPIDLRVKAVYRDVSRRYVGGLVDNKVVEDTEYLLNSIDTVEYRHEYGLLLLTNSKISFLQDDYADAFRSGLFGLNVFIKLDDDEFVAAANVLIGNILQVIGEHQEAISFYDKSIGYYDSVGDFYRGYTTRFNSLNSEFVIGDPKSVMDKTKRIVDEAKQLKDDAILAIGYINIGLKYSMLNDYESAKYYYLMALGLSNKFDNDNVLSIAKYNLASCYLVEGDTDKAYNLYREAERYYSQNGEMRKLMLAYLGLSNVFASTDRYDSAYYYSLAYDSMRNAIMGPAKIAEIQRLQAKDILAEYKAKLELAESNVLLHKRLNTIIILAGFGVSLLIAIILLVVFGKKRLLEAKIKVNEIERQKLQEQRISEEKLAKLEKQKLLSEINLRNREISSSLLLLSSKNDILKKVINMTDSCKCTDKEFKVYRDDVVEVIKDSIRLDDEWAFFKLHFDKVHPDFFKKLKDKCKHLTENDLRFCAYIKIGMNSKNISQMSAVTVNSVNITRYKIKKKLGIEDDDISLNDYIRNL